MNSFIILLFTFFQTVTKMTKTLKRVNAELYLINNNIKTAVTTTSAKTTTVTTTEP